MKEFSLKKNTANYAKKVTIFTANFWKLTLIHDSHRLISGLEGDKFGECYSCLENVIATLRMVTIEKHEF